MLESIRVQYDGNVISTLRIIILYYFHYSLNGRKWKKTLLDLIFQWK
jgi:hypothetical protein